MRKKKGSNELAQIKPFDEADFEELKSLLGVGPLEAALAAQVIHEVVLRMRLTQELNSSARAKSDLKALGQLEHCTKNSANLLGGLGVGDPLMSGLRKNGITNEALSSLIENLRVVSKVAGDLLDDPAAFRLAQGFRDRSQNALSIEGAILWPALLKLWMRIHGKLELSSKGPLMRFIELAHRHAGITREPDYETIRSARKRNKPHIESVLEAETQTTLDVSPSAKEMARALLALEEIYNGEG